MTVNPDPETALRWWADGELVVAVLSSWPVLTAEYRQLRAAGNRPACAVRG